MKSVRAQTIVFGFLSFLFHTSAIISTSKFPFHNPLVMKYYNFLEYFSYVYNIVLLQNSFVDYFVHIRIYPIHMSYMVPGVLFTHE